MNANMSSFLLNHLRRIDSATSYAISQKNNHVISEAVALFVGGTWLSASGNREAHRYKEKGRRLLERQLGLLVYEDGEFAQHSSNYQRFVNDLLCFVEVWRRHFSSAAFSSGFYRAAGRLNGFLCTLLSSEKGEAPNMGGNDGAFFLPLFGQDYSDFRPSCEVGQCTFGPDYASSPLFDKYLEWLNVQEAEKETSFPSENTEIPQRTLGGLQIISNHETKVFFRRAGFRYRPANCDVLNVDLWHRGQNIIRDSGSFSYGPSTEDLLEFHGSRGHNAIMVDGSDQMPAFSRFLFVGWLSGVSSRIATEPRGDWGEDAVVLPNRVHLSRRVELTGRNFRIIDAVQGDFRECTLRLRLCDTGWDISENGIVSEIATIRVESKTSSISLSLTEAFESRYYKQRDSTPLFQASFTHPTVLTTTLEFLE
jgi:hypothetical protein